MSKLNELKSQLKHLNQLEYVVDELDYIMNNIKKINKYVAEHDLDIDVAGIIDETLQCVQKPMIEEKLEKSVCDEQFKKIDDNVWIKDCILIIGTDDLDYFKELNHYFEKYSYNVKTSEIVHWGFCDFPYEYGLKIDFTSVDLYWFNTIFKPAVEKGVIKFPILNHLYFSLHAESSSCSSS